jgi:hypothetical protein
MRLLRVGMASFKWVSLVKLVLCLKIRSGKLARDTRPVPRRGNVAAGWQKGEKPSSHVHLTKRQLH